MAAKSKQLKQLRYINAPAFSFRGTNGDEIKLNSLICAIQSEKWILHAKGEIESIDRRLRELKASGTRRFLKTQPAIFLVIYGLMSAFEGGLMNVMGPLLMLLVVDGAAAVIGTSWLSGEEDGEESRLRKQRWDLREKMGRDAPSVFDQVPEEIRESLRDLAAAVMRHNDQVELFNGLVSKLKWRSQNALRNGIGERLEKLRAALRKESLELQEALPCAEFVAADLALAAVRGSSDLEDGPTKLRERMESVSDGLDERVRIAAEIRAEMGSERPKLPAPKRSKKKRKS